MTVPIESISVSEEQVPDLRMLKVLQNMKAYGVSEALYGAHGAVDEETMKNLANLAMRQQAVDEALERVRSYKNRNTSGRREAVSAEDAAARQRDEAIIDVLNIEDVPEKPGIPDARHDLNVISVRYLLRTLGGKAIAGALEEVGWCDSRDTTDKPWNDLSARDRAAGDYNHSQTLA